MNFLRIAWRDFKSMLTNRIVRVSVIGIIVIPLLYSLLYLAAFWDPYSRLQDMPVAVVNLDKGGEKDAESVNYGKNLVNKLKEDKQLGWRFVTKDEADKGVKGSKYYAEFIIPENFSNEVLSAKNGKPVQANITFSANEKRNFLAAQINGKVEVQLKATIVKTITNEYATQTFDSLYEVKDGFTKAAKGSSDLKDGLGSAKDGGDQLKDGIGQIKNKIPDLANGIQKLSDGSVALENGVDTTAVDSTGSPTGLKSGVNQLNSGIGTINSGLAGLNTAVNVGTNGQPSLNSGITSLYNGITKQLAPGVSTLNTAVNAGTNGQASLVAGITLLNNGITQQLAPGVSTLNTAVNVGTNGQPSLVAGITSVDAAVSGGTNNISNTLESDASLTNKLKSLQEEYVSTTDATQKNNDLTQIMALIPSVDAMTTGLNNAVNVNTDATHPSLKTAIASIDNGITNSKTGLAVGVGTLNASVNAGTTKQPSLVSGVTSIFKGITDSKTGLAVGVGTLNASVNAGTTKQPSLVSGVTSIYNGITNPDPNKGLAAGITALKAGGSKLYSGSNSLVSGVNTLSDGTVQLKNGLGTLNGSVPQLADGTNKLYDGSSTLSDGMNKLYDGSGTLYTGLNDGSVKLNKNLINSSKAMGAFISDPLSIKEQPVNPVKNYGTGFAPYFIPLSLWVGALMMFFVITDKVDDDISASSLSLVAGKYISYGFIGTLQALLVSTVVLTLGLHPTNIVLYYVFNIFMSFTFIAIIQCLVFLLGQVGRALAIVLLILQLTACAGTFPLEVVPKLFKVLNPFMPFTYCVSALREVISATSVDYGLLAKDLTVLGCILAAALVISVLFKGHADKVKAAIHSNNEM
ncbi:YhgE/Pip domain-containing protein [Clostridium akagii]|uniref:YhgE/Pip domain-containing protein n=1 Tax=Clostridium akagii TaxID=91623 RepID=UPI000691E39B|nr:YhgE/Pip domain-containing protein [Clostridium akagii]